MGWIILARPEWDPKLIGKMYQAGIASSDMINTKLIRLEKNTMLKFAIDFKKVIDKMPKSCPFIIRATLSARVFRRLKYDRMALMTWMGSVTPYCLMVQRFNDSWGTDSVKTSKFLISWTRMSSLVSLSWIGYTKVSAKKNIFMIAWNLSCVLNVSSYLLNNDTTVFWISILTAKTG